MNADVSDQAEEPSVSLDSPKETRVEDIASLVAGMNRFLSNFGQHPAFREAKISLAEWLVLSMLAQKSAENSKGLIRILGLSPQRLKQILDLLKNAGLVEIAGGAPRDAVALSEQGRVVVNTISAALQPQIVGAFKGKERVVPGVDRGLKMLYRAVTPTQE
jgi:DNA-binding MarR family transcriptional regulator